MRKIYHEPATEVAKLQTASGLLTGSVPAAGVGARREGYGDANIGAWD